MHRKLMSLFIILVLIPAVFLTGCKKAAPDINITELTPEDETVIMQEEAIGNTEEIAETGEATAETPESDETVEEAVPEPVEEVDTTPEEATPEPVTIVESTQEPTPEPTPEPVETPQPVSVSPGTYVVQAGDTLFRIAVNHGTTVEALAQANSITNPSMIVPGQELVIPAGSSSPSSSTTEPLPGGTVYIVKSGDNLFRIGLRFGYDQYYLARYNGIENVSMIYVGQEIRIP